MSTLWEYLVNSQGIVIFFTTSLKVVALMLPLLLVMAYTTYLERKTIAFMQLRVGPNTVGFKGLLQPMADIIKLLSKEIIIPAKANKVIFLIAPLFVIIPALLCWAVIPFTPNLMLSNLNIGLVYLLAISSISVLGVLLAGWASNSKYAILGALRAGSQMISYELAMGFVILTVVLLNRSLNLSEIVNFQQGLWNIWPLLPLFIVFIICILAETNRAPFDLPETESELVGGYNVEYSSTPFALFYMGEYLNMLMFSALTVVLFLGGWLPIFQFLDFVPGFIWFILKTLLVLFIFLWVRATLPRFRYDKLMSLGWKVLLPFTLIYFVFVATCLQFWG